MEAPLIMNVDMTTVGYNYEPSMREEIKEQNLLYKKEVHILEDDYYSRARMTENEFNAT